MTDAVQALVFDALHKGRIMRQAQRDYFATRSGDALTRSKQAERDFDAALDEAAWAVKNGTPRPTQGELGL